MARCSTENSKRNRDRDPLDRRVFVWIGIGETARKGSRIQREPSGLALLFLQLDFKCAAFDFLRHRVILPAVPQRERLIDCHFLPIEFAHPEE